MLAAVIERATAKETAQALRVDGLGEGPRGGARDRGRALRGATGEATAILSQLPGDTADSRPSARQPAPADPARVLARASLLVGGAIAYFAAADREGSQRREPPRRAGPDRDRPRHRARPSTTTPRATTRESDDATPLALDGDPTTAWETERYNTPRGQHQEGRRPLPGRRRADRGDGARADTPKAAWTAAVYARQRRPRRARRLDAVAPRGEGRRDRSGSPRHRRGAIPLLPGVDHRAPGGRRAAPSESARHDLASARSARRSVGITV